MIRRTFILLLAIILSLLVWWVGPLVAIGSLRPMSAQWVRWTLIAIIMVVALWPWTAAFLGWLVNQIRAPKSVPASRRQRDRVTSRFYDAIRTLKHVGLSEQKSLWRRFIYRLRKDHINDKAWFLVLGPAGSGKTSLINESGKRFLLSEQYGFRHTVDIGATRDCNWWLTEKAVYIDTAGEWTQIHGLSEEASKAQSTLFPLIRRSRRHPGIDGVILCLDANWLLNAPLTERKSLADALCARMLEVAAFFRSDIAVYLALNNIDILPGGEAFLAEMGDEMLGQGIGFPLIYGSHNQVDYGRSDTEYSRFASQISSYIQQLLQHAPTPEQRQQLLFFTESVGSLRKPLFSLLEQVFPQLPAGYSGQIRQVWFGSTRVLHKQQWSGEEELRPAGHLYGAMLDCAVQERGAVNARHVPLRQRVLTGLRYACVCAFLSYAAWTLAARYQWEEDYIAFMTASFDETRRIVREIPATNRISDDLVSAYEQLGYMSAQMSRSEWPLLNPYFEHSIINKEAQQTYHRHLFKFFWPALERYVLEQLELDISSRDDRDVYNTLKVYLMMGMPQHRQASELENWFATRWNSFAPQGYSDADKRMFMMHLRTMFSPQLESPVTKLNPELVRMARVKAMAIPISMRVLQGLQQRMIPGIENISLATAAGTNVSLMLRRKGPSTVTDMGVPAFYTLASYHDVFRPQLSSAVDQMIKEEAWVLRDGNNEPDKLRTLEFRQKLTEDVRKLYLLEYADHWDKFLKDIRVRPVASLDDAAQLARQLSSPSSPLSNLLRFVTRQTSLNSTETRNVSGWVNKSKAALESTQRDILGEISGNRSYYRITPEKELENRFEVVRRLGAQLMQASGANNDPLGRRFEEIYNQLSTLSIALRGGEVLPQSSMKNLTIAAAQQPEPVRSIMQDLLDVGSSQSLQQSRLNLNSSASTFTSDVCRTMVAGLYPFDRHARNEAGIGDFSRMFSPTGSIKRYFQQHLAPYVDDSGGKLRIRESSRGLLSAATLKNFENAMLISDTFFSHGGNNVAFSMFLRPLSLSPNIMEAVLDIDGQIIRYSHGSTQPVRIQWPGKNGGAYVRLSFKDANGKIESVNFNGPWALFHLYDKSNPLIIDRDRRELTMGISSISGLFKLEIRSTMKDFPLWSRALGQFSCPNVKR